MNLSDLRAHWDYFLALDEDLRILRRYIAFHEDNLETFSLELHRIIQMAALEVEAVLLSLCRGIFGGCGGKRSPSFTQLDLRSKGFIRQKWGIEVEDLEVHFLGLGVPLKPLDPQGQSVYPWWDAYTSLKHGRTHMKSSRSIPSASPRPPVKKSVAPNKLRLGLQVSTAGLHPLPKLLLRI
ncbi:hypothetical protein, partial [Thermus scotoductus]|uniref:hypothetical protein n=1 Tax=Thermus scotoductus TaxID=37636 RepID=UPI0020A38BB0